MATVAWWPCARTACAAKFRPTTRQTRRGFGYCTRRCSIRHRIEQGWKPHRAGVVTGEKRRRRRREVSVARVIAALPSRLMAALDPEYQARLKAALYVAYDRGRGDGLRHRWYARLSAHDKPRLIAVRATREEFNQVRHAAHLRGLWTPDYVKLALNAAMRHDGVDAVLFVDPLASRKRDAAIARKGRVA